MTPAPEWCRYDLRPACNSWRPAIRVHDSVIFTGGAYRELTLRERLLLWLGRDVRVSETGRSGPRFGKKGA